MILIDQDLHYNCVTIITVKKHYNPTIKRKDRIFTASLSHLSTRKSFVTNNLKDYWINTTHVLLDNLKISWNVLHSFTSSMFYAFARLGRLVYDFLTASIVRCIVSFIMNLLADGKPKVENGKLSRKPGKAVLSKSLFS